MVSLKKEPQIREITPIHLIDEDEAIQIYCPPRESTENDIKISVKQADNDLLPAVKDKDEPQERTFGGLNKWEWAEIIIKSLLIMGGIAVIVFLIAGFLGEGLTLAKDIATKH